MPVVNIRTEKYDIYVGRNPAGVIDYGNPIRRNQPCPICGDIHSTPGSTLRCYRRWLWHKVSTDQAYREGLWGIRGLRLGCHCKPNPCHGDVIEAWHNAGGPYRDRGVLHYMRDTPM